MTQKERRLYLIRELLKEQPQYRDFGFPDIAAAPSAIPE